MPVRHSRPRLTCAPYKSIKQARWCCWGSHGIDRILGVEVAYSVRTPAAASTTTTTAASSDDGHATAAGAAAARPMAATDHHHAASNGFVNGSSDSSIHQNGGGHQHQPAGGATAIRVAPTTHVLEWNVSYDVPGRRGPGLLGGLRRQRKTLLQGLGACVNCECVRGVIVVGACGEGFDCAPKILTAGGRLLPHPQHPPQQHTQRGARRRGN